MSNFVWYIGLAIIFIGIAAYAIFTRRVNYKISTLMVFYCFTTTITWIGEFVVLGLFNSYAYKPGLIQNQWAQNLIGHLLLNTSMFPAVAIVMASYSFRYGWIAFTAVIFVLIEYIYVRLGLYEQHWWRYYMSAINITVFMLIAKKWFSKMIKQPYGSTRAIIFYFVAVLFMHFPSPILLLLGKQHYQLSFIDKVFTDYYRSSIFIAFTYHLLFSGALVFFVCMLKKWYWNIVPFIISITFLFIFSKLHILIMDNDWKLIYSVLIEQICILIFFLIEKYTLKPSNFT